MNFSELEKSVRELIAKAETKQALAVLNDFFEDSDSLNEIALLSASYYTIINKQHQGIAANQEEIALKQLRVNILEFLQKKKEDLKYREKTFGEKKDTLDPTKEYVKVFFSLGTPHNDKQQEYVEKLTAFMEEEGILLETLKTWNQKDPIVPIIEEIKNSSGCLVLAFERIFINKGASKRGSEQQSDLMEKGLPSTWLQIEAAIARSFDIPLIILKEESLEDDGLIQNEKQQWNVALIHENKVEEIYKHSTIGRLLIWVKEVKKYKKERDKSSDL